MATSTNYKRSSQTDKQFNEREMREFIENKLTEEAFLEALYSELLKIYSSQEEIQKLDSEQIYQIIIRENLLERLIHTVHNFSPTGSGQNTYNDKYVISPHSNHQTSPESLYGNELMLYLRINDGKCFTDFLNTHDPNVKLAISISFLQQRHITKPITASIEPGFNQAFILKFGHIKESSQKVLESLLTLNSPISFTLIKLNTNTESGANKAFKSREVISIKDIEWRF